MNEELGMVMIFVVSQNNRTLSAAEFDRMIQYCSRSYDQKSY